MDICFSKVSKYFDSLCVMDNFSYSFQTGKHYCLMGPSGCGKSTLLRLACGLIQPDSGNISGIDQNFSYVFQENRLLPWYTAQQNIDLVCHRYDTTYWLNAIGLTAFSKAYPSELSGGMCRRLSIARALAANGEVYLFDEPLTGLDNTLRKQMICFIHQHTAGKLCIYTSHHLDEAQMLSNEILQFSGPPLNHLK